jgi:hypothetical protein
MTIAHCTVISNNEDGNIEVQIEHKRSIIDMILGCKTKTEKYIHPKEKWFGVSVWRDKETLKFVSPKKVIEIINIIHLHNILVDKTST